jgi:hypothetical protein
MTQAQVNLPKPEIRGIGHITYVCAMCWETMEPEDSVIVGDLSFHTDHAPEIDNGL